MEFARQFVRDNNGRLLASGTYLAKRGWTSVDVITRAKRELLEAGFIFETVKGQRPNKASWYAVTWRALDKCAGYDFGSDKAFERGAYLKSSPLKIDALTPRDGVESDRIAPPHGVGQPATTPPHGAIKATLEHSSTPSHGDHLEKPSAYDFPLADASSASAVRRLPPWGVAPAPAPSRHAAKTN